ncbi:MAG: thermonuclease family protein [Enhydrobacter sp.]|nr:MAG: thermonuclease family protein [Enhydrobacter sp.]
MKRGLALLTLAGVALAAPATAQPSNRMAECSAFLDELPATWQGKGFAVDGGTLVGLGLKPQIRLWGIQAPELTNRQTGEETVPGMRARAALEDILAAADRGLTCRFAGWDRSCRAVAQCTVVAEMPAGSRPQPHDVALRLLEDGMVYGAGLGAAMAGDATASERYAHHESLARKAGKGLWPLWLGAKTP